jgi:hypothetical protein
MKYKINIGSIFSYLFWCILFIRLIQLETPWIQIVYDWPHNIIIIFQMTASMITSLYNMLLLYIRVI